jgi:hypothetical protein
VAAHQDDHIQWEDMSRAAQLNSACDAGAKAILRSQDATNLPPQEAFPLETICMFVEGKKMTSDTGAHIRYADCTVLLSSDKQDVHGRVRQGRLASSAPDSAQGGALTVSGLGV